MQIIKKLIVTEWVKFFLGSLLIFLMLLSVGNLISGFLRPNLTASDVLLNYIVELPTSFNRTIPIACLIGSLFSINKLKSRNELTAIFAAGYSRKKYFSVIFQLSLVVAMIQFLIAAYVQPFLKSHRETLIENSASKFRNQKSRGLKASTIKSGLIWYKSKDYYFSFLRFDSKEDSILGATIYFYDDNYLLKKRITTPKITNINGEWIAKDVTQFNHISNNLFPSVNRTYKQVIPINESLDDFRQIEADITTLNFNQLYQYIHNLRSSGLNVNEYLVLFLDKISISIICIVFALLACIPVFNPNRRNSSFGKSIGFVFVFTVLYWLINSYTTELGLNSKIDPYVATFSVPACFILLIFFFFYKNRKLS